MLGHFQQNDHLISFTQQQRRGGYAFSADGLIRWDYSHWEVLPITAESYKAPNPYTLLTTAYPMPTQYL